MIHPTPPLSGENLLLDDEDVILLTDEIPPVENHDLIDICQLADRSEPREVLKLSDTAKNISAFIDLSDVIEAADFKTEFPPDFSVTEADILNFDLEDTQATDAFPLEPKTTTENIASLESLRRKVDAEIKEPSTDADDGEIFLQENSPSTLTNEFFDSGELASATAQSAPLFTSDITNPPDAEYQIDDLQRLIDEVVHDSQCPPQDFSGIPAEISKPKDTPIVKDDLVSVSQDQIDAAMERVIRNLFAERIENILDEVITTTVNREIENLKTILLDHLISGKTVHKVKS